MPVDAGYTEHVVELLGDLGTVRTKRMFSGTGLHVDDLFLALIVAGRLYLKTDAATAEAFVRAGSVAFGYDGPAGRVTTRYLSAPDEALESAQAMRPWARLALEAALRASVAKTRASPKATPAAARRSVPSKAPRKKA